MGWLRLVGSFKLKVSFAECSLFYTALLQKSPIILRCLLIVATPYQAACWRIIASSGCLRRQLTQPPSPTHCPSRPHSQYDIHMYTYIHICLTYIHDYIHTNNPRSASQSYVNIHTHSYISRIYICVCMYIYIYMHTDNSLSAFQSPSPSHSQNPNHHPQSTAQFNHILNEVFICIPTYTDIARRYMYTYIHIPHVQHPSHM